MKQIKEMLERYYKANMMEVGPMEKGGSSLDVERENLEKRDMIIRMAHELGIELDLEKRNDFMNGYGRY